MKKSIGLLVALLLCCILIIPVSACLDLQKTVDSNNDGVFLDEETGYVGETAHWRIVVTNCGTATLNNIKTTDTNGKEFGPVTLAPGTSIQYDYDTIVNEKTTNTAGALGFETSGTPWSDSDSATTLVIPSTPCLDLQKTVDSNNDGVFLDEETGYVGETAHWRIVVTNCGTATLNNIKTIDTNGKEFGPVTLAPGTSTQYNYDTIVNEKTTNTAGALGFETSGTPWSDSDSATALVPPTCIPTTEICNGLDDDCDGVVDNGIASTPTTCGVGECASTGTLACVSGSMVNSCKAGDPTAEICDIKDNDCDGTVDESLIRGTTCGTGACASTGTETCTAGNWGGNTCNQASTDTNDCGKIGECVSGVCVEGTQAGFLLPTQTSCQMYAKGYRETYIPNQFNYILKGTKIGSISPGVISYYNTITAPSPAFILTVPQKNTGTGGNWNPMLVQQENKKMQAYLYDKNCNIVTTIKTAQSDPHTVTFDVKGVTTGNTYFIGIKYTPTNLVGITPTGVTRTYFWSTVIGNNHLANSDVSIPVIKK